MVVGTELLLELDELLELLDELLEELLVVDVVIVVETKVVDITLISPPPVIAAKHSPSRVTVPENGKCPKVSGAVRT